MRAATVRDGKIVVEEHPDPVAGPGEVLVRVRASGVNGADLQQRAGRYPAPPGAPATIPGLEFAGEVVHVPDPAPGPEAVGGAARFAVGDRVTGIVAGGGQAELVRVHERQVVPVPEALDWPAAGGFSEVFFTAWDAIVRQGGVRPGERLVVHGAAGGVGTAAIQIGRALGAHVTATVRRTETRARLEALGAHEVLDAADFADHDGVFDVVLELVGGPNLAADVDRLAPDGRIVVIGVGGGAKAEVNLLGLMQKRARILASTLRARPLEQKATIARSIERELLPLVERGDLVVPVAATFPLAEAQDAYEHFASSGKVGKVVITCD